MLNFMYVYKVSEAIDSELLGYTNGFEILHSSLTIQHLSTLWYLFVTSRLKLSDNP